MKPFPFLRLLLGLFLTLVPVYVLAADRPNVILVITDDQGYGDLSLYGNPVVQTPHLDGLAQTGVSFDQFHVMSMCTPTRGALLTGLHPLVNGAMGTKNGRHSLRPELPTLPQALKDAGYRTGLFGKWHLGSNWPNRPIDKGFERFYGFYGFGPTGIGCHWNCDYIDPWLVDQKTAVQAEGWCTDIFFDQAMNWVATGDYDQPFFAMISTNAPHFPFWAPEEDADRFRHTRNPEFFAMVADIDENMGRLEDWLSKMGLIEDTILIFLTDNGTVGGRDTYNAGMRGHKATPWEGGHRVPLFVRWPAGGLAGGRVVEGLATVQDLFPTLLELCDSPRPENAYLEGISLASALRGTEALPEDRMLVMQIYQGELFSKTACVMWKDWRLLWENALFDLSEDPGQEVNVAREHPEVFYRMWAHYQNWFWGIRDQAKELIPEHIGHPYQKVVTLDSGMAEWGTDGQVGVRQAEPNRKNGGLTGPWQVEVHESGTYHIALRRWPVESGLALDAPAPAFETQCSGPPTVAGRAIPIERGVVTVDGFPYFASVADDPTAIHFEIPIEKGRREIQASFHHADGSMLCGAFYAEVELME